MIMLTNLVKANAFNQMVSDIRDQRYGSSAQVFRATFDDAVANGLYERVCFMAGKFATPEGKEAWYTVTGRSSP